VFINSALARGALSSVAPSDMFMPHGHCYFWDPGVLWLQVASNTLIGASYVAIAATLAYLVSRIRDIPFKTMYVAFGVFIVTCGFTHFLDVWVIWSPDYYFDGSVRAVTALASVGTALALPPLVPKAVALARGAKAAHDRGIKLESAVEDLARMYEKTRELDELKTQFFANVSHELRTPLALIMGPIERMRRASNLSDDQRHDLEVAARNSRTLLKHVNDLLDIAKIEAGRMQPDYVQVDLSRLVRVVAGHFDALAVEQKLTFTIDVPSLVLAEIDSAKIERVILNLLSNAFKFTPAGGKVTVKVSVERVEPALRRGRGPTRAWIEVSDTGPGIPVASRTAVFERFRQLEVSGNRSGSGTGLGLAICKEFVELHGGTIAVDSSPEGGACFRIELPLGAPSGVEVRPNPDDEHASLSGMALQMLEQFDSRPRISVAQRAVDRPTVLVVEDNADMNRFVCEGLSGEYNCEPAYDGQEGYDRAIALRPDLIITDLMMPKMTGEQLVAAVRNRADLDDVPIMLLSAKADDELRVRLLREGAQEYVVKPFAPEELVARAKNLVSIKRAKDYLRKELATHVRDVDQLAREVSARQRELQHALETARSARDQAIKASQVKTNFLRLVSHELRTPLTVISLQVERLRSELGPDMSETLAKIVRRVATSTNRLTELIESVLQHARIESGKLTTELTEFSLADVAAEVVEELKAAAEAKGLALTLTGVGEIPALRSDRKLVRLIVSNLVANAVKFTSEGYVAVKVTHEGGRHSIAVSDTGPGIPLEHQREVFEPFVHLEPIKQKHAAGVGLGLSLVKEMVAVLGGRIRLESAVDAGSTFSVELPALAA
jgi:signal transduction histidine kinase